MIKMDIIDRNIDKIERLDLKTWKIKEVKDPGIAKRIWNKLFRRKK